MAKHVGFVTKEGAIPMLAVSHINEDPYFMVAVFMHIVVSWKFVYLYPHSTMADISKEAFVLIPYLLIIFFVSGSEGVNRSFVEDTVAALCAGLKKDDHHVGILDNTRNPPHRPQCIKFLLFIIFAIALRHY